MELIATQTIQDIYATADLEIPDVIYFDHPLECLVALMVLDSNNNNLELGVEWQNMVEKLNKHWDYINYAFNGDFSYHKKQIPYLSSLTEFIIHSANKRMSYIELEIYKDFKVLFPDYDLQRQYYFNSYFHTMIDQLPSLLFIPFAKLCLVCDGPDRLPKDINRPHTAASVAIKFKGDYELYFWNGIRIPGEWVYNMDGITRNTIFQCQNIEQRRALAEILGNEKFVALLDLCIEETDHYNNQQVVLYRTRTKDKFINDYLFYIKVICNSTNREYFICIPREAFLLNAIGALAWTFGLDADEYQLLIET